MTSTKNPTNFSGGSVNTKEEIKLLKKQLKININRLDDLEKVNERLEKDSGVIWEQLGKLESNQEDIYNVLVEHFEPIKKLRR